MALLLTLMAVSFLVVMTIQLITTVNWQMTAAANQADAVRLDAINLSVMNIFRAALLADSQQNNYDTLQDNWATMDRDSITALFPGKKLSFNVTDLSGRLQVNGLVSQDKDQKKAKKWEKKQRELWIRFLTSGRFAIESEDDAQALVDSLSDWIDTDSEEREYGAENDFYKSQNPSRSCRNGPFQYLEELLLVKGMNRQILYGDDEHSGLAEYITVAGQDGTINLNTAPAEILLALNDELSEDMVEDLLAFREDQANYELLNSADWYKDVKGVPGDIELDKDLIVVVSSMFLFSSEVRHKNYQRMGSGVIYRADNHEQSLLYWKVE